MDYVLLVRDWPRPEGGRCRRESNIAARHSTAPIPHHQPSLRSVFRRAFNRVAGGRPSRAPIAVAGSFLESDSVEDLDLTAVLPDTGFVLQVRRRERHPPTRAEA
jgi:hypothetical protein